MTLFASTTVVLLVVVLGLCHSSSAQYSIALQNCGQSVGQKFTTIDVPANIPKGKVPSNAFQLSQQPSTSLPGCEKWSDNSTDCIVNVKAWDTKLGSEIWITTVTQTEPVEHELNRVWVLLANGSLQNPASGLCLDAHDGVAAKAGAGVELSDCGSASSSSWVISDVDGSVSQKSHAGGYPGLCLTMSTTPNPHPGPSPSPPSPPLPSDVNVAISVDGKYSNSRSSEFMASFNFDWHADSEEPPYWINCSAMKIPLKSPMLVQAAKLLSPAVLRLGGSEGDVVCYDVPTHNSTCASMNQTDPQFCLTMERYGELVDFCKSTNLKFVFGLNAVWGRKGHSLSQPLDLTNIEALLAYTAENNFPIYGFELGNEKCGPPPAVFAQDYHNLHALLVKYWPEASSRPLLIGNDCNTNPGYLTQFLPLVHDVLDVTTYHHYDGYGLDPQIAEKIMTPHYLDSTVSSDLNDVHAMYAPKSQLWVGEAAAAWHSGAVGVTNAFVSSFWWADALAALSAHNHTGYCRQTLLGGNYGLINRTNYEPNPDWYISKMFHQVMGDVVLEPTGFSNGEGYLRAYAQCARNDSGIVVLLINIAPNTTFHITGNGTLSFNQRQEYVFTAETIKSRYINLNGVPLGVKNGEIPALTPQPGSGEEFQALPHSISFLHLPNFQASVCN